MEKKERTKLYMVTCLAAVFVLVGYFRFLHGKITFFNRQERDAAIPAMINVPAIDLKGIRPAAGLPERLSPPRAPLRNIFAPAGKTSVSGSVPGASALSPQKPLPTLQLTGTIIGGKSPLAVINGRLLRQGESIEGFQVLSIARNQVIIASEGRKVVLNVLDGK